MRYDPGVTPEETLVEEFQKGSQDAFRSLLKLHQARVRGYLGRFLADRDAVEDLAQETFLAAYRGLETWNREAPFGLWLLKIAKNRALNFLRQEGRRRTQESRGFGASLTAALERELAADESAGVDREIAAMRTCLATLPEHSSSLVREYYFHQREATEIARDLQKNQAAVWRTLFRIRQALRRCVQSKLAAIEGMP
jgi:RNA polymerase sigma-70 factor, ECF subfamily